MSERFLSKITESMRNDLQKHALRLATSAQKVVDAKAGEEFQNKAFDGGAREYFQSREELRRHYDGQRSEARAQGESELTKLLEEFNATMNVYFRLDNDVLTAAQAKLSLAGLNDADIRRIAESGRDSFTTLKAVASYGITNDNQYAKTIAAHLRDFEKAASAIPEKAERYVKKALASGDKYRATSWDAWIKDDIAALDTAYETLQSAVDGDASLPFADALFGYRAD